MTADHEADQEREPSSPAEAEGPVLEWTSHPAKRRPWVTVLVLFFILVVSLLVFLATESKWFTFFALLVLFASLAKYFFPTRYRMDNKGITIKTTTQTLHKTWSQYRSYYADKNGILLSPFPEPSRLENFRGLFVLFGGNRDEVTAFVQARMGRRDAAAGSSPEEGQA